MSRVLLLAWVLVAALVCWRLDPVDRPLLRDNRLYFFLAERAASGVPPHVSHVDSKNQLGVLLTAAAIAGGRRVGVDDVLSSRLASIVFAAAAVALAAELAALLAGSAAAGHVAALALLAARGFVDHAAAGNNVKIFMAAFALLAHVAMARRLRETGARGDACLVVAGLAAGSAFLCWQPALLVTAAVVVEALVVRAGGLRAAGVVALSAAAAVATYELYFAAHGALAGQLHQAYTMSLGSVHHPRRLAASLLFVMTEGRGAARPLRVVPLAFALFAVLQGIRLAARPRRALAALREVPGRLGFALAAAGATAFTLYDHQGLPDLFFPDPYFAVATGLLAVQAADAARGAMAANAAKGAMAADAARGAMAANAAKGEMAANAARGAAAALPVAVLALALGLQMLADFRALGAGPYGLDDQRRLAGLLKEEKEVFGSVWAYEAVHLLGLAHLDNHVPYGLFYDDVRSVMAVDTYRPLDDLGRMPGVIVHSGDPPPGSGAYLGTDYTEATGPDFAAQSLRVWRRRGERR